MSEREKRYAVAPEGCQPYLTPGKRYEMRDVDGLLFRVTDDRGDELACLLKGHDGHVNGRWLFTGEPDTRGLNTELLEALEDARAALALLFADADTPQHKALLAVDAALARARSET